MEETTAISRTKEQLNSERAAEDIKRVEAGERANKELLKKLTDEMRAVMKDALRNKDVPTSTVAEWQQLTERLDEKASPPMQQAGQALQKAAQQPESRDQQLAEAKQHQQKALDEMRDAAGRMNTTAQNLYARNFYNRLRAAASAEHKVSDGLKGLAKETVGLRPEEIAESLRKDFDLVAGKQDETTKDVNSIVNDMAGFLKRVPNEKYDAVHREMQDKKVVAELTELSGFVRSNLGLKSVGRARQWGEQLDAWASMLQAESSSSQGGGGETDPELLELVVAMVRAAQGEDTVREQTLLLESRRAGNQQHEGDSKKLATLQDELRDSVGQLREKTKFDDVKPLLEKVEDLMDDAARKLRKGNTGEEVVSTEAAVIELLVPPEKKSGSGSMAKMQQKLQQMMAQATKGRSGGGNNSKSNSSFGGEAADGAAAAANANDRTVEKAGGAANAGEWPEEFRDQLQSYLQAVEAK